jgi:hypothetical protein
MSTESGRETEKLYAALSRTETVPKAGLPARLSPGTIK